MGLFRRTDSPFWWVVLEGHGRKKESTGIPWAASSPQRRAELKKQAESIYHARMIQLARARVGLPVESAKTFSAWSAWYLTHHTAKHRGAIREKTIIATLTAFFGAVRLSTITPSMWAEYETERRAAKIQQNTIGRELAVMKAILSTAVGEHLESNPLASVKRKTKRLPPKRTLTEDEDAALLKAFTDDELRDLYIVGVGTLLRQRNLIDLQRTQHRGDRLVLEETKTGPHTIPLTGPTPLQTRAAAVLARRMPDKARGHFFPKWHARFARYPKDGEAHIRALFLKVVRRAVKRAGIPWGLKAGGVVWHTMTRASGATRMLRDYKQDVRTVQLIGGWRSLDQMQEYLGLAQLLPITGTDTGTESPKGDNQSQLETTADGHHARDDRPED